MMTLCNLLIFLLPLISHSFGLDLIGYWGQSDLVHDFPLNSSNFDVYDQINIAFAFHFSPNPTCNLGDITVPYIGMNFAGYCYQYLGSCPDLLTCPSITPHIQYRQSRGQRVCISMGGSAGAYSNPSSQVEASKLAQLVWDMFLGGNCTYRPFGNAILDGVDLDLEAGGTAHWDDFVIALRALMNSSTVFPPGGRYWIVGCKF